jgi:DNA-binding beta-propeller fold protein YncE
MPIIQLFAFRKPLTTAVICGGVLPWLFGCTTTLPDQSSAPTVYAAEAVASSPDGRYVAAATGAADSVFLFDATTRKTLSYMTPKDGVTGIRVMRPPGLAFSHDGKWLASSSWRESIAIRIWDVASHAEMRRISGHPDALSVAFAPDDKRIAAAGPGKDAFVWDSTSGELVAQLPGHNGPVLDIAFSPEGRLIATGCADGTVRLFDGTTYTLLKAIPVPSGPVTGVAFSPDGQLLATSAGGLDIRVWAANTGEALKTLTNLQGQIEKSRSGEAALTALFFLAGVRGIQLVGAPTPAMAAAVGGPARVPICSTRVAFSPDGRWLAAVIDRIDLSFNSRFHLFLVDLETGRADEVDDYHGCTVAFSADGSTVIGGGYGGISVYDVKAKKLVQ